MRAGAQESSRVARHPGMLSQAAGWAPCPARAPGAGSRQQHLALRLRCLDVTEDPWCLYRALGPQGNKPLVFWGERASCARLAPAHQVPQLLGESLANCPPPPPPWHVPAPGQASQGLHQAGKQPPQGAPALPHHPGLTSPETRRCVRTTATISHQCRVSQPWKKRIPQKV